MTFKTGEPRPEKAGRRPGSANKLTRSVRQVLETAADRIGGVDRLVEWIQEEPQNERLFWSVMYIKLLPLKLHGEIELNDVRLSREELARQLAERNLPFHMFGADVPLLQVCNGADLDAEQSNGKIAENSETASLFDEADIPPERSGMVN